jgi:PilZ domain
MSSGKSIVYEEIRTRLPPAHGLLASMRKVPGFNQLVAPMEVERRSFARTTISKNALLFFDGNRGVLTCRVHDITNHGAGIEVHGLNLLPPNFELTFDNFHTVRECRVIWRQGDFVGVAFLN